ncbi:unnamed protein product [Amoebophrya sp. A25]|nr:unnamed protein product [Amoebophrya sp. A25]|eukprot:GSA25T00022741001.1
MQGQEMVPPPGPPFSSSCTPTAQAISTPSDVTRPEMLRTQEIEMCDTAITAPTTVSFPLSSCSACPARLYDDTVEDEDGDQNTFLPPEITNQWKKMSNADDDSSLPQNLRSSECGSADRWREYEFLQKRVREIASGRRELRWSGRTRARVEQGSASTMALLGEEDEFERWRKEDLRDPPLAEEDMRSDLLDIQYDRLAGREPRGQEPRSRAEHGGSSRKGRSTRHRSYSSSSSSGSPSFSSRGDSCRSEFEASPATSRRIAREMLNILKAEEQERERRRYASSRELAMIDEYEIPSVEDAEENIPICCVPRLCGCLDACREVLCAFFDKLDRVDERFTVAVVRAFDDESSYL